VITAPLLRRALQVDVAISISVRRPMDFGDRGPITPWRAPPLNAESLRVAGVLAGEVGFVDEPLHRSGVAYRAVQPVQSNGQVG
jgi:hypothetical protein